MHEIQHKLGSIVCSLVVPAAHAKPSLLQIQLCYASNSWARWLLHLSSTLGSHLAKSVHALAASKCCRPSCLFSVFSTRCKLSPGSQPGQLLCSLQLPTQHLSQLDESTPDLTPSLVGPFSSLHMVSGKSCAISLSKTWQGPGIFSQPVGTSSGSAQQQNFVAADFSGRCMLALEAQCCANRGPGGRVSGHSQE